MDFNWIFLKLDLDVNPFPGLTRSIVVQMGQARSASTRLARKSPVSYRPPWAHYLGGYQDRLLGGPLGLLDLRCTVPDGVKHKDYRGEVLG
jgi:hypothetical protein